MSGMTSISGLVSGMDWQSLVEQLISVERRPAYLLESRIAQNQLKLTSYDALEASLLSLKSEVNSLRLSSDFDDMIGSVSHESILSAVISDGATAGTYSLSVQQIAQNHQIVSQAFADPEDDLGTGTISILLGEDSVLEVTLESGSSSVQDFVDAVNDSDSGISANLVQTSDSETPWQLILTSDTPGAANVISVDADLTGGSGLTFGSAGDVVPVVMSGSSTVTSSGNYSGNIDDTFTFTVEAGGSVGSDELTINWTNTEGLTGTITLDADYSPGDEVQVHAGLILSFGAGTLATSDSWTVETESAAIQAAQDALLHFGSSSAGSDPLEIISSDNTISGLITGVTLNLLSSDVDQTVTLNVAHDTDGLMDRFKSFVESYNNMIGFMNAQFDYDADLESAGPLIGDRISMNVDSRVRSIIGQAVEGISTDLGHLSQIGIGTSVSDTLNTDGTLSIDDATLRNALENDLDGVVALLASSGETTDSDIRFIHAGASVTPTGYGAGYELNVTQAAARGLFAGASFAEPSTNSPLVIGPSNNNMKISVDGVTSKLITLEEGEFSSGADLAAALQNEINADDNLGSHDVLVSWEDDGGGNGHLSITSKTWGSSSTLAFEDVTNSVYSSVGIDTGNATDGVDVEGYFLVNGSIETATGTGRNLVGDEEFGLTNGLRVQISLDAAELADQGQEQGRVRVFSGIGDGLHRALDDFLNSTNGILSHKQSDLRDTIIDFEDQVEAIDERLEIRKARYLAEFQTMETLIADLQSQSNMVLSMLGGM
jgi:flagellar hook-associated protein 2